MSHPMQSRTLGEAALRDREDRVAFWALIAFTLVVYLRPQDIYPPLGALRLGMLTAAGAAAFYIASVVVNRRPLSIMPTESVLMVIFFGFVLFSVPMSMWAGGSTKFITQVFWKLLLIFFLVVNTVRTVERLRAIVVAIFCAMLYMSGNAIIDTLTGQNLVRGFRATGAVEGMLGDPNDLAMALVIILPFALTLAILAKTAIMKLVFGVSACVLLGGIILTYSRGGMLGLVLTGFTFAWLAGRGRRLPALLLFIFLTLAGFFLAPKSYQDRISTIVHIEADDTGSVNERLELIKTGFRIIAENPVLGVGAFCFEIAEGATHRESGRWRVAHNTYIEVAAEIGVIGGVIFICNLILAFVRIRRLGNICVGLPEYRDVMYWSYALVSGLVGYGVCAFFLSHQYTWDYYYLIAFSVVLQRIARGRGLWDVVRAGDEERRGRRRNFYQSMKRPAAP